MKHNGDVLLGLMAFCIVRLESKQFDCADDLLDPIGNGPSQTIVDSHFSIENVVLQNNEVGFVVCP
jgi:hypothetical protein